MRMITRDSIHIQMSVNRQTFYSQAGRSLKGSVGRWWEVGEGVVRGGGGEGGGEGVWRYSWMGKEAK